MPRPPLPTLSSPENSVFHPAFKAAVNDALAAKRLTNIRIQGQYPSPTGPVDFVLLDTPTNKVIVPIEIKRTQSSVRGLGRRQARDYWANLGSMCKTPFYCSCNLELLELFRYDIARPRTSAQRIKLGHALAGELGVTSENDFYDGLIKSISEMLDIVLGIKNFEYISGLTQFQTYIDSALNDRDQWHQAFIPACFEYIRGAAGSYPNLHRQVGGWKEASFYSATPDRLNQLGGTLDFSHIFCPPAPRAHDPLTFSGAVLLEAFESGKTQGRGDDIAELVNETLAPIGLGIVETDTELAQLLAIAGRAALGRDLDPAEKVFDPGSGSGRLLTALTLTAFPNLTPKQVIANEIESRFAESLSLRLGLCFAPVLTPSNIPKISIGGIEKIEPSDLKQVKLVVMNPPFVSGVMSADIKGIFISRIRAISGMRPILADGQIALEALFLELVWHLVPNGTVIATIFPAQHLFRLSDEVVKLRQFLTKQFGMSHIVLYPRKDLFQDVIKQTVLLVGVKGSTVNSLQVVEVQKTVGNVDFGELANKLPLGVTMPTHGVFVRPINRCSLTASAHEGWKSVFGAGSRVASFISRHMAGYSTFAQLPSGSVRRGTVGNSGNTGLTVKMTEPSVVHLIPDTWMCPVLNNTDAMPRILTLTNTTQQSFIPPSAAYTNGTPESQILRNIVTQYKSVAVLEQGSQPRAIKTVEVIIRNLKSDQKYLGLGWVLIQRASRTEGEIAVLEQNGILLSTNVLMAKLPTPKERALLASWLLSVFGQIQLELYCTPQEGMRKLELGSIKKVAYPDFSCISVAIEAALLANLPSEKAIQFSNVALRSSDQLWAEVVCPSDPVDCLDEGFQLLRELIDERKGFSG